MKISSLARLSGFRRQQLDLAEAELARLNARREGYESEIRTAAANSIDARDQAAGRAQADGNSLAALQDYLDLLEIRQNQSAHAATQVEQEIARQMGIVLTARREVEVAGRLLDKQRRLERLRVDRVEQARADEWFLTRLSRRRREHFD